MAAPTFGVAGTPLTGGSSTGANVPVPASVVKDSLILVPMYVETTQAVTLPSGFAEMPSSPAIVTGASAHDLHVFYKRATAADSGTYNFTIAAGVAWRFGVATRFDNVIPVGLPFESITTAVKTTNTTGTTPSVTGPSTSGVDRLWVLITTSFVSNTYTPPSGTTERVDITDQCGISMATKPQAVAGGSGALSSNWANNTASAAVLFALKPAEQGMFFAAL